MINCACGKPAPDAFLCRACSERLRRALGDLPALIADLDITLTRQAVTGAHGEGKPTKKDAQPLSLHIGAAEVASDLRYKLATSIRYLTEQRGIIELPADNPVSMANWLLKHHDSIRLDPAGPDIAADIHAVTAAIMDVVDLPKTRSQFKVGNCPEVVGTEFRLDGTRHEVHCPGEVWAHLPAEDLGEPATMECRACGKVWPTWEWSRAGDRILKRGNAA